MAEHPNWRPGANQNTLRARAAMLRQIREFFAQRQVLEVETPLLGKAFGPDPSIEPLCVEYHGPDWLGASRLYLQSSPEFYMKRLLADGSGSIYQVSKAFRNGEAGRLHRPEFTLLEWYRIDFSLPQLMQEVAELMRILLGDRALAISYHRYADLFSEHLSLNPLTAQVDELRDCAVREGIEGAKELSLDQDGWLDLLMSCCIEPKLPPEQLCFVTDYPASQASLARINPHDPGTAARFELYYHNMELANGFAELNDVAEQAERFEQENCRRRSRGQFPMPVDVEFLAALEFGLPDCSGVALGLDRVLMAQLGLDDIQAVLI